jgi:uncharacterized membrane protein
MDDKMSLNAKQIKEKSLNQLKGNWDYPIIITLAIIFLNIFMLILSVFYDSLSLKIQIVSVLLSAPLCLGLNCFYLSFIRNDKKEISKIFEGFQNYFRALLLYLLISVLLLLWTLLFIIPGIIKLISYSMAFYVLADNPKLNILDVLALSKKITDGHKMSIFMFSSSFMWWFLLSVLSFGIGLIWFIPYYNASFANLYEELKSKSLEQEQRLQQ